MDGDVDDLMMIANRDVCDDPYSMFGAYRLLRAQFSSENIEPPLVGKVTRRGFQRAIICMPQSSFSQVLLITRCAGRTQLAAEAGSSMQFESYSTCINCDTFIEQLIRVSNCRNYESVLTLTGAGGF